MTVEIRRRNMNEKPIPNAGGGDCLFWCVAQALDIPMEQARARAASVATFEEYWIKRDLYTSAKELKLEEDIENYKWLEDVHCLEEYREKLAATGKIWGDAEAIANLERAFGFSMLLFVGTPVGLLLAPHEINVQLGPEDITICVLYHPNAHYELLGVYYARELPERVRVKLLIRE